MRRSQRSSDSMGRHKDEIVDLYSRFAAAEIGRHVE